MKRKLVAIVLVLLAVGLAPAAMAAGPDCEKWNTENTEEFFKEATPADVTRCVEAGADPNARDKDGMTPLARSALYAKNLAVVKTLLTVGADPQQATLLLNVIAFSEPAILKVLLDAGVDPNTWDEDGNAPLLHHAAVHNKPAILNILLDAGADPNARSEYKDRTPLHRAAQYSETPAIIKALIAAGANINAQSNCFDERTPLDLAVKWNENPVIAQALLDAGAEFRSTRTTILQELIIVADIHTRCRTK